MRSVIIRNILIDDNPIKESDGKIGLEFDFDTFEDFHISAQSIQETTTHKLKVADENVYYNICCDINEKRNSNFI